MGNLLNTIFKKANNFIFDRETPMIFKPVSRFLDRVYDEKMYPQINDGYNFLMKEVIPRRNLTNELMAQFRSWIINSDRYHLFGKDRQSLSEWLNTNGLAYYDGGVRYNPLSGSVIGSTAAHEGLHKIQLAQENIPHKVIFGGYDGTTGSMKFIKPNTTMVLYRSGIPDDNLVAESKAFPIRKINIFGKDFKLKVSDQSHSPYEKDATSVELLYDLSKKHNGALGEDLDLAIDGITKPLFFKMLMNGNGYSEDYMNNILLNSAFKKKSTDESLKDFKTMLHLRKNGGKLNIK